jgi:hypothetical protein
MNYLGNWTAARYNFVLDKVLEEQIYKMGYAVAARLDKATLDKLLALYSSTHSFSEPNGGMFYSVYSNDINYRKKVHDGVTEILKPVYDSLFTSYKTVISSFIVKLSGPKSEFYLHQDSTGLDEFKYSPLSIWIPLSDVNTTNGCMCVIPKTHTMFSPYRGISIAPPFDKIQDSMHKYLLPLELSAGDVLVFDNRLVHNSVANASGKDRVVVMSGIFPSEADIISCFKDSADPNAEIELIRQPEGFLLEYPKFLNGCYDRPDVGELTGKVKNVYGPVTATKFDEMCNAAEIFEVNTLPQAETVSCNMIAEPYSLKVNATEDEKGNRPSFISRVKAVFNI